MLYNTRIFIRTMLAMGELIGRNFRAPRIITVNNINMDWVTQLWTSGCLRFRRVYYYLLLKRNYYPAVSDDGFIFLTFWSLCSYIRCFFSVSTSQGNDDVKAEYNLPSFDIYSLGRYSSISQKNLNQTCISRASFLPVCTVHLISQQWN